MTVVPIIIRGHLILLSRLAQVVALPAQTSGIASGLSAGAAIACDRSAPKLVGAAAILGTQTEAQIDRNYGELDRRVILQGTCTKLILNCRDGKTAEVMADLIGKQERIDMTRSDTRQGLIGGSVSKSEQIREVHTVMPGELQSLPPLEGYLTISDGTPAARVTIEAQGYGKKGRRFVPIEKKAVPSVQEATENRNDINRGVEM
jgi:hypothetical protein